MIRSGGFVVDVRNVGIQKRRMQSLNSGAHVLRFYSANAEPKQAHFLGEGGRIGKHSAVIGLRVQFPAAKYQGSVSSTESADIGKEIEMIERNLKCRHGGQRYSG